MLTVRIGLVHLLWGAADALSTLAVGLVLMAARVVPQPQGGNRWP